MSTRRAVLRAGAGVALAASGVAALGGGVAHAAGGFWKSLAERLAGDLVLPTDPTYDFAKQGQYGEFDAVTPAAVAYAVTVADVQACVRFARARGVPVRVRSGGHSFLGWSTGEGLVIDVSRLNQVAVSGSTVHLGTGLQAIDGHVRLGALGRQFLSGTCPTVCEGGFLSGGGIGFQTRKFGVGVDRIVSATAVLADGSVVRASDSCERDLFWALRGGGGGNFGVVTDFEVKSFQQPSAVYYQTMWPWDSAHDVVSAWQQWTLHGSRNLGSNLILLLPDASPGATPLVIVYGLYLGPQADFDAALADFAAQAGVQPQNPFVAEMAYADAMKTAYGCGQITVDQCHRVGFNPQAVLGRTALSRDAHRFFDRPFTTTELDTVVATWDADRTPGQTRVLNFLALGGAGGDPAPDETAFVHRGAQYIIGFNGTLADPTPAAVDALTAWNQSGADVLDPIGSGAYVNFPGHTLPNWQSEYYGANYPRLLRVKHAYDPDDFFRHPRSIGSTGS